MYSYIILIRVVFWVGEGVWKKGWLYGGYIRRKENTWALLKNDVSYLTDSFTMCEIKENILLSYVN